tara:strand:- start:40 stop:234 length:195 start_codon:yes stop_codon:yes gene_type:complete
MKKFEYKVEYGVRTHYLAAALNQLGEEGWELVQASDTTEIDEKFWEDKDSPEDSRVLFFKRELK